MLGLVLLGILAAFSVWMSEMPRAAAVPVGLVALAYGNWLAWRHARRLPRQLVWPIDGVLRMDGLVLHDAVLSWRGPLAFVRWRDDAGRTQRLAWWPDTLSAPMRRELKLAAASASSVRAVASMAP